MKMIGLLVKIANKEDLPKKIVFEDVVFNLNGNKYEKNNGYSLGESYKLDEVLNDEVIILDKTEIMEDKPKFKIDDNGFIHTNSGAWKGRKMDIEFVKTLNYLLEKSDSNE